MKNTICLKIINDFKFTICLKNYSICLKNSENLLKLFIPLFNLNNDGQLITGFN